MVPGSEGAAYVHVYVAILHVDLDLVLVELPATCYLLPATCNLCVPLVLLYYCTVVADVHGTRVSSTFNFQHVCVRLDPRENRPIQSHRK